MGGPLAVSCQLSAFSFSAELRAFGFWKVNVNQDFRKSLDKIAAQSAPADRSRFTSLVAKLLELHGSG